MKKVEAVIRPGKLDEIKSALSDAGCTGITVSNVLGFGLQKGYTQSYRGQEVVSQLLPKIKMETVCPDHKVKEVIDIITRTARTGEVGDGKIFVSAVEESIRIRTGETGEDGI